MKDEAMRRRVNCFIASISLQALNASSLHCFNFLLQLTFYLFIASWICLLFNKKNINTKKWWSLMKQCFALASLKYLYILRKFRSKAEKLCHLCFHICVRKSWAVIWRFWHEFIQCWQRWSDEVRQWRFIASIFKERSTLHCYDFLVGVKWFIAVTF